MANRLLDQRNKAKKIKPDFIARESHHIARVKSRWRYPGGNKSLVRMQCAGKPALPHPGFGSPKEVFGLHHSGLKTVLVHTVAEINLLDPKTEGAVFGATVGKRKKLDLLAAAQVKKIRVLNCKDLAKSVQLIKDGLDARKKHRVEKSSQKDKKEEEKKKKAEEKTKKKDETSAEEKVEEQKEMVEKVLTTKQ